MPPLAGTGTRSPGSRRRPVAIIAGSGRRRASPRSGGSGPGSRERQPGRRTTEENDSVWHARRPLVDAMRSSVFRSTRGCGVRTTSRPARQGGVDGQARSNSTTSWPQTAATGDRSRSAVPTTARPIQGTLGGNRFSSRTRIIRRLVPLSSMTTLRPRKNESCSDSARGFAR